MTRINCVPVEELTRQHLIAEYRELPRVFKLARVVKNPPPEYTLGKGHVTFFYDKLKYCFLRFEELVAEMQKRGYKPQHLHAPLWSGPSELWNDWTPTEEAKAINRARIRERLFGAALDSHEEGTRPDWAVPLQVGLGYSIIAHSHQPTPVETVEVSADEFDQFFLEHFPNFGVEQYYARPACDDYARFIHPDRTTMNPDLDISTRIGAVQYQGSEPVRFFIKKETYDAAKSLSGV